MDKNTLSHTTWECKYHIVFAPKHRRQIIYGKIKADVANILSMLCRKLPMIDEWSGFTDLPANLIEKYD